MSECLLVIRAVINEIANMSGACYSGLDIVAIKQCVTLLVDLAKQGRTVVCTIHQPNSSLFHMFDHVYMLARGSCIYNGTPRQLVPFLAQIGHVCKPTHNPADYGECDPSPGPLVGLRRAEIFSLFSGRIRRISTFIRIATGLRIFVFRKAKVYTT